MKYVGRNFCLLYFPQLHLHDRTLSFVLRKNIGFERSCESNIYILLRDFKFIGQILLWGDSFD
jgi:hypothetical protein